MPPPTLLGAVAAGYERASAAGRQLTAVLLPVVAAMLLVSPLLDLWSRGSRQVIVDGIAVPREADGLAWLQIAAVALLWIVGLIAGARTVACGEGPVPALWQAVKRVPPFAVGVVAVAGCLSLLLRLAGGSLLAGAVALLIVALVASRLLLSGIVWAIEGSLRWPAWRDAGSFLLGGFVVPSLMAAVWIWFGAGAVPILGALLGAAQAFVVLAAQVGLATAEEAEPRPARRWPGVAMLAAAALVSGAVAAPSVRTHDRGPASAVAVAWPAGQHPVIVTHGGVWFCDNDPCDEFTQVNGGPMTIEGFGTATIAADGTVIKTAVTGGPDKGGPFANLGRCTRDGCRQAWIPLRANAREKLEQRAQVQLAGAAAPDGSIWLFVAKPVAGAKHRFSMIRCADVACASPQRHDVGTGPRGPEDWSREPRARLSVGADGRPAASFWTGRSILRFSCAPVTCAAPAESVADAAPAGVVWDEATAFREGELEAGETAARFVGEVAPRSAAVAVAGPFVYVTGARPGRPDSGFHLTVGRPERYWQQTVWRCSGFDCASMPMDVYPGEARRGLVAIAGDGRLLVVRDDRIVLLATPFTG